MQVSWGESAAEPYCTVQYSSLVSWRDGGPLRSHERIHLTSQMHGPLDCTQIDESHRSNAYGMVLTDCVVCVTEYESATRHQKQTRREEDENENEASPHSGHILFPYSSAD